MSRLMVAGLALAAGVAVATPMVAWSAADTEPQLAQAAPGPGPGSRGMGMGMGMGHAGDDWDRGGPGGTWGHDGPGGRHDQHGLMHRMMHRGGSPKQACEEHLARRAGMVAYVVAKLNLTAEQKPLWDKLQTAMQAGADKERQLCTALKPPAERAQETVLDRANRREQFLAARLQAVQQARAPLEQLYQALTPEQKAIVDHPFRRG